MGPACFNLPLNDAAWAHFSNSHVARQLSDYKIELGNAASTAHTMN